MKKLIALTSTTLLVVSLFSGATMATENTENPDINEELAKMCEYYPSECAQMTLGAGNGGGNEPPYTPRKKKK